MLLQIAPPTEVTQALTSTHWGAVLLLTVFVMGSWITYLAYMLRILNKQIAEDGKVSKQEVQGDRARAEALLERAVTALTQANLTIQAIQAKVCEHGRKVDRLADVSDQLKDKIAQCPHH